MLKARPRMALCAIPLIIIWAFNSTPHLIASVWRISWFGSTNELSPERMMSIAQTFERQGRIAEAKDVYGQILAKYSGAEEARRRLAELNAAEQGGNSNPSPANLAQSHPARSRVATASTTAQPRRLPASPVKPGLDQAAAQSTTADDARAAQAAANLSGRRSENSSPTVLANAAVDSSHEEAEFLKPTVRTSTAGVRSSELKAFHGLPHKQLMAELHDCQDELLPHLVRVVADETFDLKDRSLAAFLLGALGPQAVDVLPSLRRTMQTSPSSFVRIDVAQAVLLIQPADADAIQTLLELLRAPDDNVKWYAAFALRNSASPQATFVVDALIETLDSDNDRLRRMVILTLGEFGPAAAKAVPELQAALTSPDPRTRVVAQAALATIAPAPPAASSELQDPF